MHNKNAKWSCRLQHLEFVSKLVIIFLFTSRVRYSSAGEFTKLPQDEFKRLPHDIFRDISRRSGMKFEDAFNLAAVNRERLNAFHETLSSYPRILKELCHFITTTSGMSTVHSISCRLPNIPNTTSRDKNKIRYNSEL